MKEEVSYNVWVTRGSMMYNTSCLSPDDPDHIYNQIKAQGVDPEDFGIENPYAENFKGYSRAQLIDKIVELENTLYHNGLI